ncbi:hypothetical protein D9M72_533930 [compost metagenome]
MQYRDDGEALVPAEVAGQCQHLELVADVEGGDRLVEQQAGGILGDEHGKPNALAFPARQTVDLPVDKRLDAGDLDRLFDLRLVGRPEAAERAVPGIAAKCDQFPGKHAGRWRRILRQIAEPAGEGPRSPVRKRLSFEIDTPRGRRELSSD